MDLLSQNTQLFSKSQFDCGVTVLLGSFDGYSISLMAINQAEESTLEPHEFVRGQDAGLSEPCRMRNTRPAVIRQDMGVDHVVVAHSKGLNLCIRSVYAQRKAAQAID